MELTVKPTLQVNFGLSHSGPGSVSVRCPGPDVLALFEGESRSSDLLKSVFRVVVVQAPSSGQDNFPAVSGHYRMFEDEIEFVPHFPFERDVKYLATFDSRLLDPFGTEESLTLEFTVPSVQKVSAPTEVSHILPSFDLLPENLLRFYVCFSNPMQRGRALEEIALFDSEGKPVDDALYRAPVELWDRTMRRLTVLLDPGRLKRWVGPNVELGPPLKAGGRYTLEIGAGMTDAHGRVIGVPFRKHFTVGDAVREPISLDSWKIEPPVSGTFEQLALIFPSPVDWALLFHAIKIQTADRQAVNGKIAVDQSETRWTFTPTSPWKAGPYSAHVESTLEDICGNSLIAAFDTPLRSGPNPMRHRTKPTLTFQVR
jgi:hypothetical protein